MKEAPAGGEDEALAFLARNLPAAPPGATWFGDDAAVLGVCGDQVLFSTDLLAEGVHFDRALVSLADLGWKALSVNVSDLAAMGGRPLAAVVALAGARAGELAALYEGLSEAAAAYGCPLVGGDLSDAATFVVSVAILGTAVAPVRRSGARPGDAVFVTAPLGGAAAGLRELRADPSSDDALVAAHRRPRARLGEGIAAANAQATAMIDLSDGLGIDLDRLCVASGVGVELAHIPVAFGASEAEALSGGEDYELCFTAPDPDAVKVAFAAASLRPPIRIGTVLADPEARRYGVGSFPTTGYLHRLD